MSRNKNSVQYFQRPSERLRPCLCKGCRKLFWGSGVPLCAECQNELPYTHFWEFDCEPALHNLSTVVHLEHLFALCFYTKDSLIPRLIHEFKYQGQWKLALAFGDLLGTRLRKSQLAADIDCVTPVPLHWKKTMTRGYNQSEFIARGIARQMGIPMRRVLRRHRFTQTQTLVGSHYDRQFNVKNAISLKRGATIPEESHMLLVDDMVTTGATLMACTDALKNIPNLRVSVASVGIAKSLITSERYVDLPICNEWDLPELTTYE